MLAEGGLAWAGFSERETAGTRRRTDRGLALASENTRTHMPYMVQCERHSPANLPTSLPRSD